MQRINISVGSVQSSEVNFSLCRNIKDKLGPNIPGPSIEISIVISQAAHRKWTYRAKENNNTEYVQWLTHNEVNVKPFKHTTKGN